MKKALVIIILGMLCLTACAVSEGGMPKYVPYAQIPADYSLEDAKADGLVVSENADVTSGQDVWDEFLKRTQSGKSCMVRLACYYSLDDPSRYSPEYYEEIKDDFPCMYILDLKFDGKKYTLYSIEDGTEHTFEYDYLRRFEEEPNSPSAIYSSVIMYILINDKTATWADIYRGVISSQFGDYIPHYTVYSKYTYK